MTTSVFLSPVFGAGVQVLSNSGVPLGGGKIYVYLAGTTTATNTYTTNTGTVLNPNPIVLDSSGRCPSMIWLPAGQSYKFVVTDSLGNPVGYTLDGIAGINDASYPYVFVSEWNAAGTPTYISGTSFSITGDQTSIFTKYRRVKTTNTGGVVLSSVVSATFATGVTTIVLSNDSGSLDSGLTAVYYGFISPAPSSLPATVVVSSFGAAGTGNLFMGNGAGLSVTGDYNFAFGDQAMHVATSSSYNVAIGRNTLSTQTTLSVYNVAIGDQALKVLTTGSSNTALGAGTLFNNQTGSHNVAVGSNAISTITGTSYNVGVGDDSLLMALGGTGNVGVGYRAGYNGGYLFGDYNIYVGYQAKPSGSGVSDTNSIVIGYNVASPGSNTIQLGNSSHTDTYLSGRIRIPQYTTAGAPAYVKGALYFDTTLNKLRVGGATAWETVTSV